MAPSQSSKSGQSGLISRAAIPRPITMPLLVAMGAGLGQLVWTTFDSVKAIAWLAGLASPFCILCATAVWAMRDKMDLAFMLETLGADAYRAAFELETSLRRRSTWLAAKTCLASLLAAAPAISNQLIGPIWQPMVILGGGAIGYAASAYLVADYWDHQLRAQRSKDMYEKKVSEERRKLLSDGSGEVVDNNLTRFDGTAGWTSSSILLTSSDQ